MAQQEGSILVTGATGNTGRAIVDALVERGAPVRAMVRAESDRSKLRPEVEGVVADFDESAAVAAALDGAERAYLVTPSSEQVEEQQKRFAELAAKAGTRHLVVLSQLGAQEPPSTKPRQRRSHSRGSSPSAAGSCPSQAPGAWSGSRRTPEPTPSASPANSSPDSTPRPPSSAGHAAMAASSTADKPIGQLWPTSPTRSSCP